MTDARAHVVLLGDSIFDNAPYVAPGEPAVVDQLGAALGAAGRATLLAIDGDVTAGVSEQLRRLPDDATHLVISTGGNDALRHFEVLQQPASSVAEVLGVFADIAAGFRAEYEEMLDAVLARGLPTAVCTVYEPRFADTDPARLAEVGLDRMSPAERRALQRVACAALCFFDDAILRAASERGLPVIELRAFFTDDADYANPIEPAVPGGEKLVARIRRVVAEHDFAARRAVVYV